MWLLMVVACLIQQSAEELIRRRHQNPQEFMNIDEIITYWGYPSEQYQILTEDGYYLQVNRIPYGVHSPGKTGPRPAVLLGHGVLAEGRAWIENLPSNSLAFVLADAGYDVWILNFRGTTWSRQHRHLSIEQQQFWDFSFHESGIYDVPATIDFVLQKTQQDALYYVGHSQGGTAGLIAFSVMPQLAQKVKLFIAFAPAYTLEDAKGFLAFLMSLPTPVLRAIFGSKEFCLVSNPIKAISAKLCSYPGIDQRCIKSLFTAIGFNENNINVSRADVYVGIFPDFTSVNTAQHWKQIFDTHQFKYYDYGSKNKEFYNSTTPPFYKIEDMVVPTAVWYGGKDILVTRKATELLLPRIPRLVFQKYVPSWEHFFSIWDLDNPERLYPDVLSLMQQYK